MDQQHGRPAAPPQYSPDGRWWWNGERWVPVHPAQLYRQPAPERARSPSPRRQAWLWTGVGTLMLIVIVCTAVAGATSVFPPGLRKLILGGASPPVPHVLATASPPGVEAIPPADAPPPSRDATLDVRAITAQVVARTVNLTVELHYGQGEAGGTGIVLTSSGLVLTDEHVIFEADSITARVAGKGRVYKAALIGADPADDVALLQLEEASGLATATLGNTLESVVGDQVVAIGYPDAEPVAVRGKIIDLGVSSDTQADGDWPGAHVTGMLETDAHVIPGQSGGPVVDSSGRVLGMLESGQDSGGGLATPTEEALQIARQIAAGLASSRIVIGLPAVLGVVTQDASGRSAGAQVISVHAGTPAQSLGLHFGDVVTRIDGTDITSELELALVLVRYHPGDRVSVTWIGLLGITHQGKVTLAAGPGP